MLDKVLATLVPLIIATISSMGYLGIALLMAIESACIPLPSEIIMPFSGYLVSTGRFDLWLVATAGAIGCNIGSTIAYAVGDLRRPPAGRELWRLSSDRAAATSISVDRFFARFGSITVFIAPPLAAWCAPSSPFPPALRA